MEACWENYELEYLLNDVCKIQLDYPQLYMYKIWAKALTEKTFWFSKGKAGTHPSSKCRRLRLGGWKEQRKYNGTSPWGHLYSSDTSTQGTQNLVSEKCSHYLCICHLYLGERDTFSWFQNATLTSIQGTPQHEKNNNYKKRSYMNYLT